MRRQEGLEMDLGREPGYRSAPLDLRFLVPINRKLYLEECQLGTFVEKGEIYTSANSQYARAPNTCQEPEKYQDEDIV